MGVHGNQSTEASGAPPPAALAGALVCAGVALLLTLATGLITFGLSQSYGFGPAWDLSAFMMTGAAASLAGTALLGAIRLARLQLRALPVMVAGVAFVFAVGTWLE
ncbi:hypothetical protein [Pedococcus sp. 5OH_020]|uniref:hypothetical protein n=1 Tax=Pedococcus sp. 5OH_020 TaxID=2989814 RepID=UPI0022E9BFB2|nr:hypothetical protein [Pedococcus sp. 5OH_020]